MRPLDFLKRHASTPLRRQYLAAGAVFEISTNSESILAVAQESFAEPSDPDSPPRVTPDGTPGTPPDQTAAKTPTKTPDQTIDCRLRFWVDPAATSGPPWPNPYFRGLDQLVFAGFDPQNSLLADLGSKQVIGRFSPALAADRAYWKSIIFPVLLTLTGATLGIAELHCACVSHAGEGLLLAGASGSGKSTLTLALARAGFRFLSDDRTYLSRRAGELAAWGLPTRLKLRPEAAVYFPELRGLEPRTALNGERAFELDLEGDFHWTRASRSDPRRLIFLERLDPREPPAFELTRLDPAEAAARLAADLLPETPEAAAAQRQVIDELVRRPVYRLRYSGDPPSAARALIEWCEASGGSGGVPPPSDGATKLRSATPITSGEARRRADPAQKNPDPLRRFLPTPLAASLPVMGRAIRLETNSARVLDQARRLLAPYAGHSIPETAFRWRIVSQADPAVTLPWPEVSAFSGGGCRYITFGHRSFAAVDLEAREAVAFLPESLAADEPGFSTPFLERLFLLTAGALGLTPLAAACVSIDGRALLIFGPPMSGKTTSCYLSTRRGLEFHADQATFLEPAGGGLAAWGEFWPTAFRLDALKFLPELEAITRPFQYLGFRFRYLDKNSDSGADRKGLGQPAGLPGWIGGGPTPEPRQRQPAGNGRGARRLTPVCCLFLERQPGADLADRRRPGRPKAGSPRRPDARLLRLEPQEFAARLDSCLLFIDDARFEAQQAALLRLLQGLPAYHLIHGSDSAQAAAAFRDLLDRLAMEAAL